MSDFHWNGSNIAAPMQKMMPPMNLNNLSMVAKRKYSDDPDTSPLLPQ